MNVTESVFLVSNYLPALLTLTPIFLWFSGKRKLASLSLLALTLNTLIVFSLKSLFNVPRAYGKGLTPTFPSAHSATAFAAARFFKYNDVIFVFMLLLSAFVAVGRVYTGYHTAIDVLAGAAIGYAISEVTIRLEPKFEKIYQRFS